MTSPDNPFSIEELGELQAAEQAEMDKLALPFSWTVEVRPVTMPTFQNATIADFSWAVRITSKARVAAGLPGASHMYVVGGEDGGPFQAIQRAIDRHAFGIDLEQSAP